MSRFVASMSACLVSSRSKANPHLWPPLGYRLGDFGLLVGVVGVFVQIFWFLVFGVNEQRWYEQARANL